MGQEEAKIKRPTYKWNTQFIEKRKVLLISLLLWGVIV